MTYTGVTPYLVRYNSGDNPSLQERVDRAASIHADVFVSVHINSADAESARGFEIWVPNASSYNYEAHVVGEQLASKIESQLAGLGLYDRGIKTRDYPTGGSSSHYADGSASDYYGVIRDARKAGIPGIIVEHAFITNSADASKLASDSFRNQLGVSDATGIAQQYGLGKDSETRASASVAVTAHIAGLGWENAVYDGKIAGTTGKSVNLEAFKLSVLNDVATSGGISYRANVEGSWQGWKGSGEVAGTTGQSKAVEAVQIKLTGDAANKYDIYYRVHSAEIGWLDWAKNGESAGTNGYGYGAQALEVVIVNKSAAAPGSTARPYLQKGNVPASIECRGHVSDVGWQAWAAGSAGTTGQSRRLEALQLRVAGFSGSGDVECQAHVQDYGWMGWQGSGSYAGTTGQSKRVEAVRIRLTGELAEKYDVWYRVHSQEFGWLGWASDGASAGTQGYGYRAEAVEVRLLPKGSAAPGTTDGAFRNKDVQQSQDQVESEPIMGNATKPAEQMAATYMRTGHVYPSSTYAAKGAPTIQDFCSIVESEAKAEGVRPEVVFAQAMLETGWLQFGGSVKAEQCNFAGIGALNATVGGASFPDVATGIRAQVQHLKAYASTDPLKKARVDPRFSYVERGCAPYVTDLNGRWAVPGTNYGQSIISVMNAI